MEFTKEEIYLIKTCIYIASRESFYCVNRKKCDDAEEVGKAVLKKLGYDDATAEDCVRGY